MGVNLIDGGGRHQFRLPSTKPLWLGSLNPTWPVVGPEVGRYRKSGRSARLLQDGVQQRLQVLLEILGAVHRGHTLEAGGVDLSPTRGKQLSTSPLEELLETLQNQTELI